MSHKEYRRIVPGADTAVLFVHGIVGTPEHFRVLIPLEQSVPESWSVHNVLLPGHGGTAEDFAAGSMNAWREHVRSAFEELAAQHDRVIIAAHSMGTLFAIQLAVQYPEKVSFLFLLGVPMRPGVRLTMMRDSLMMVFGKLAPEHVLWKAAGVTTTKKLWKYLFWVPRFLELFREIYRTEKILGALRTPCVAYQSQKDELVTNLSRGVLERSGVMEVRNLLESTHFYYSAADQQTVISDFMDRIKRNSHD